MENTKAIQVLTKWIQFLSFSTTEGRHAINSSFEDLAEASTAAVEALGKQIPKPVVAKKNNGYLRSDYSCPVCGVEIRETFRRRREGCYCEKCGQRLTFE